MKRLIRWLWIACLCYVGIALVSMVGFKLILDSDWNAAIWAGIRWPYTLTLLTIFALAANAGR